MELLLLFAIGAIAGYQVGRDCGEARVRREWQEERLKYVGRKIAPPQGGSGTSPPKKPNEFAHINNLLAQIRATCPSAMRTHPCE